MDAAVSLLSSNPFAEYFNLHGEVLQILEFFLRMIVASLCGAVIGFERSKRFKEAGIRTHVIVCMASALFMIVSKHGFADFWASNVPATAARAADPARVAAQVVTGISFLGAGVIFKNGNTVKGLTTAAGIWATSAIGLAIGGGLYYIGLFGTVLMAVLQFIMHRFKVAGDGTTTRIALEVSNNEGFAQKLSDILARWHAKPTETQIIVGEDGSAKYDITLRSSENIAAEEIMSLLSENEVVKSIGVVTSE